jgi:hypothetical protein
MIRRHIFLHDDVRICACGTERRDAGDARNALPIGPRSGLPDARLVLTRKGVLSKAILGLSWVACRLGTISWCFSLQKNFRQARDAGGRLQVSDIDFAEPTLQ